MEAEPAPNAPRANAGRPTIYSADLGQALCERLIDGQSLRTICLAEDMPGRATVLRWLGSHEDFRTLYHQARAMAAELIADEILEIADDSAADFTVDEKSGALRLDKEAVLRSRLRVDARKWWLSKMLPRVFGDRLPALPGAGSDPSAPIHHQVTHRLELTPEQRRAATAALLAKQRLEAADG